MVSFNMWYSIPVIKKSVSIKNKSPNQCLATPALLTHKVTFPNFNSKKHDNEFNVLFNHTNVLFNHTNVLFNHTNVLFNHTNVLFNHTNVIFNHTNVLSGIYMF